MIYVYDAEGSPVGFRYRNSTYYAGVFENYIYGKNIQGDIIYIFNVDGDKVAEYAYDAWGNPINTNYYNSSSNPGVTYSPFRYRGYWYDEETGLYYLNSRYYNPEWGRFLNADIYLNANGDIIGFNMFAYCGNDPVNYLDTSGKSVFAIIALVVVLAGCLALLSSDANHSVPDRSFVAHQNYNSNTVNVFEDNTKSDSNKINLHIYGTEEITNVNIDKSLCIDNPFDREAVLDVFMESDYYSEETFGTKRFMLAQWEAHNLCYKIANSGQIGYKAMQIISGANDPLSSSESLDLRSLNNLTRRQRILYTIISWVS